MFIFDFIAALMNRFHTPVDGRLDHVMYQKHDAESFVFSVKACTGIMIGLYGPYYGDDGYFVWLGGGSGMDRWNGISKRKDVELEVKVTNDRWPPTVQCETAADFWVSWDNKRVAAGEGREVSDDVMIWKRLPYCCPLEMEVDYPHKGAAMRSLMLPWINKLFNE